MRTPSRSHGPASYRRPGEPAKAASPRPALPARRRGAALLLILGILAVLGWLGAAIARETLRQQAETAAFARGQRLRERAWSAAECVLAGLRERRLMRGGLYTVPADGDTLLRASGFDSGGGMPVRVRIADVSAAYGLGKIETDTLRELFVSLGVPPDTAPALADTFLDRFRRAPAKRLLGMKREDYADAGLPPPPERLPATEAELLAVPGLPKWFTDEHGRPDNRFADLIACLALTGDTTAPNLNTAPPAMLRHLHRTGMIPDAEAFRRWRDGPDGRPGTGDDRYARQTADLAAAGVGLPAEGAAYTVRRVRLDVTVTFAESSFLLTLEADPEQSVPNFPWKIVRQIENAPVL